MILVFLVLLCIITLNNSKIILYFIKYIKQIFLFCIVSDRNMRLLLVFILPVC